MAEGLIDDENPSSTEKRETIRQIAAKQLETLGYGDFPKRLTDYLKGEGTISELDKIMPYTGEDKTKNYIRHLAGLITRVPNREEAESLLIAATFAEPASRNPDGTITVTSFSVAEPSTTTVQTKIDPKGRKTFNPLWVTDTKQTDGLARKLMSQTGFTKESETPQIIFQVKKTGHESLKHKSNPSLRMDITKPASFEEKSESRTSYAYPIQIILT